LEEWFRPRSIEIRLRPEGLSPWPRPFQVHPFRF
jgi:hypothetical protein